MKTMKKVIAVIAATFLLTSCGQTDSASVGGSGLDFNAKVKAVELGIKKIEDNVSNTGEVTSTEDFENMTNKSGAILDEFDVLVATFISEIELASADLPKEDTVENPSKSTLLSWADGYKSYAYFQRQNQLISQGCVSKAAGWMGCVYANVQAQIDNAKASIDELKVTREEIDKWRKFAGK
jgi:hypothetical protein